MRRWALARSLPRTVSSRVVGVGDAPHLEDASRADPHAVALRFATVVINRRHKVLFVVCVVIVHPVRIRSILRIIYSHSGKAADDPAG